MLLGTGVAGPSNRVGRVAKLVSDGLRRPVERGWSFFTCSDSPRGRRGAILAVVGVMLTTLLAMVGLVLDGGSMYLIRQRTQAAADAAALAAAIDLPDKTHEMESDANKLARKNLPGIPFSLQLNYPYKPATTSDPTRVEVILRSTYQPLLLQLVGVRSVQINTRAVALKIGGTQSTFNPFSQGIAGSTGVTLRGNAGIDSYRSSLGSYANQVGANGYAGTNGNITSNGPVSLQGNSRVGGDIVTQGTVTLRGNQSVLRDVMAGGNVSMSGNSAVGGDVWTNGTFSKSGNARVNGTVSQNAGLQFSPVTLPSIDPGTASTRNDNSQLTPQSCLDYSVNPPALNVIGKNQLTMPAGTYYLSSVNTAGNAKINITGAVTLYVTNSLDIHGNGFLNTSGNPNNLKILYMGTADINWSGNSRFYGGIYAPNATIDLNGNNASYGGFVAKTVNMNGNGAIHLDEDLTLTISKPTPLVLRLTE